MDDGALDFYNVNGFCNFLLFKKEILKPRHENLKKIFTIINLYLQTMLSLT